MATDNCSGVTTSLISGFESGEVFPLGTTEVIYEATDASGNSTQCSFNVIITGNEQKLSRKSGSVGNIMFN